MLNPWFTFSDPLWNQFDRMQREIEQLFDLTAPLGHIRGVVPGTFPAVNIGETSESVIVYILAPNIDPSKTDLTMEKNILSVSAERDTNGELGEGIQPQGYHRRERVTGRFRRVISLPEGLDANSVRAQYSNGILIVTIGKREEEKARKIKVAVR